MVNRGPSAISTTFQSVFGLSLLTVGFFATLATLLGFFGSYWWAFDALANFRAQYAIILVVVAVLYGLVLSRGAGFLFLAVGALNVVLVLPLYLGSPEEPRGNDQITFVSYNVSASNNERARVLSWLEEAETDFAFLLESSEQWEDEISREEDSLGYTIQSEFPDDRRFGITVLARDTVTTEVLRLGSLGDPVVRMETSLDGRPIVVYVVHPRPATSQDGSEARDELLADVAKRVTREVDPVVVIGDLNATPWSHAFRGLMSEGDLVNSLIGFGLQPTWPGDLPFGLTIPIDHMLHTAELTTTERAVGPSLGSDHKPLIVSVKRAVS